MPKKTAAAKTTAPNADTAKTDAPKPAKGAKSAKPKVAETEPAALTDATPKKLSCIDAAAKVLAETGEPMSTKGMIEAMSAKGYWTSPGGQTPAATLYSAILAEIRKKGATARFVKTDRGRFGLSGATAAPSKTQGKQPEKGADTSEQTPEVLSGQE